MFRAFSVLPWALSSQCWSWYFIWFSWLQWPFSLPCCCEAGAISVLVGVRDRRLLLKGEASGLWESRADNRSWRDPVDHTHSRTWGDAEYAPGGWLVPIGLGPSWVWHWHPYILGTASIQSKPGWWVTPCEGHILPLRCHLDFWEYLQVQRILSPKLWGNSRGFRDPRVDLCRTDFTEGRLQVILSQAVRLHSKCFKTPNPWLPMGTKLIIAFASVDDPA